VRPAFFPHVTYVTDAEPSPDPLGWVLQALAEPAVLLPLLAGAVAVGLAGLLWIRRRPTVAAWRRFVDQALSYRELVPWMLRLSFGLVLIGAGLSRVTFAPDVILAGLPSLLLTGIGFLLLLGFAVRLAAAAGLVLYGAALVTAPQLVGLFDVFGGLAALVFVGPGRPSLDDLLRAAFPRAPGRHAATTEPDPGRYGDVVPLLVRIGFGGALLASGIADKLLVYERSLTTVERYDLTAIVPVSPELWVLGASATETALGVLILLGVATRLSAMLAFVVLTLALFGLPDDPVIAHVGLFGSCSILVVLGAGRLSVDALLSERHVRRAVEPRLRPARPEEAPALSALAQRSKAHWGYDAAFLERVAAELTIGATDIEQDVVRVAELDGAVVGWSRAHLVEEPARLVDLWVEPTAIGRGIGRLLWDRAVEEARVAGRQALEVEADPNAEGFYRRMGAVRVGSRASTLIPGRELPVLRVEVSPTPGTH
jgi:uncharacterized membrane protein YphA (DoxX/SURF4 family)/predicted N-acetyltransferase YhbS